MYCSLEEAWGSNFNNNNQQMTMENKDVDIENMVNSEKKYLKNIPSYSGNNQNTTVSNVVPYQVKFPEQSKRNYLYELESNENTEGEEVDIDTLSDNDNDIDYIDSQRNVKESSNYLNSKDYFLYKKYLNLAKKYKNKLRKKYKNFVENNEEENILENFNFTKKSSKNTSGNFNGKDIIIISIIGIFVIFALDIFVKIGMKMKKE